MLHVVLYEPEIPQNTGNIMRTCMAFNMQLHLIEPLGFYLDEKHLRRAGMDYRDEIEIHRYDNWEAFKSSNQGEFFYITRYGKKLLRDFDYRSIDKDIYFIFGKESTGIPKEILKENLDHCIRIPMVGEARSLNLSNCVALCMYHVLDALDYPGLSLTEVIKGQDFLES